MRTLEVLLVSLLVLVAFFGVFARWRSAGRALLVCALVVAAFHWKLEGAHWQMLPAYAAVCILCLVAWLRPGSWPRLCRVAGGMALVLCAASILLSYFVPMFRLPAPTGQYAVGTTTLYLKDSSRNDDAAAVAGSPRELMVQIWYPAQMSSNRFAPYREFRETTPFSSYESVLATNSRLNAPLANAGAPFPVILFNHGWGGRRTLDTFLTEELASQGYVVASIDHTYNARRVAFPDGRVLMTNAAADVVIPEISTPERLTAIWNKELVKQTADERFVLDRLEALSDSAGSFWSGRLNTHNVGAIGHSFGGSASTELCAEDARVHASVNMDGWFFEAIHARKAKQPLLYLQATGNPADVPRDLNDKVSMVLNASDLADLKNSLNRYGGYMLTLNGAVHEDFTDQPLVSPLHQLSQNGAVPAVEVEKIVRTYVDAFFDKTLRGGDPAVLRSRTRPFTEATLESWPEPQPKSGSEPVPGMSPKAPVYNLASR